MQKKISYGGLGCALCVILLAMSSYLPTLKVATLFAASVIPYVVCRVTSTGTAFAMYGAASILSFLICQSGSPTVVAAFILCFGNYPVLKAIVDKKAFIPQNALKIALYIIYFFVVYFVFTKVLIIPVIYSPAILFVVGVIVFYLYDFLIMQTGVYLIQRLNNT